MGELVYRKAELSDSQALCALMRETPMGQGIQICQERGDDFFASCYLQADEPEVWAAFEKGSGRAVGVFSAGKRSVFVDGEVKKIRYLSDLRIRQEYRKGMLLARGFKTLKQQVFDEGEWAQTLVLEDNREGSKYLTSGRAGLPVYHPCGIYRSWFLQSQKVNGTTEAIKVRSAGIEDRVAMQSLLEREAGSASFTPWVDIAAMGGVDFRLAEQGGELIGMLGIWDTSSINRTRITGYGRGVRLARPFYNVWAELGGRPRLPAIGECISSKALTTLLCKNRDPKIFKALLAGVLETRGLYGLGLDIEDPLTAALDGLSSKQVTAGHFLVGFFGDPPKVKRPFYFDFARL
ncbi:MAG: hypothetical protein QM496_16065 [Verrucomicrobiota bacterium]